jgi:hypothetical protein
LSRFVRQGGGFEFLKSTKQEPPWELTALSAFSVFFLRDLCDSRFSQPSQPQ